MILRLILITLFVGGIGACQADTSTITDNDFTLLDILIGVSQLPPGWEVEQAADYYYPGSDYSAAEAAKVVFTANTEVRQSTGMYVYRYKNANQAFADHEKFTRPISGDGEFIPSEWESPDVSADEERFRCWWLKLDGSSETYLRCEWEARYNEYRIRLGTWILPGLMSLKEMSDLIIAIDTNIERLGLSYP